MDGRVNKYTRKFRIIDLEYYLKTINDNNTPEDLKDDEYQLSGKSETENDEAEDANKNYTLNIPNSDPIIKKECSDVPVTGIVKINLSSRRNINFEMNFGNGECDRNAELTINPGNIKKSISF